MRRPRYHTIQVLSHRLRCFGAKCLKSKPPHYPSLNNPHFLVEKRPKKRATKGLGVNICLLFQLNSYQRHGGDLATFIPYSGGTASITGTG